MKSVSKGKVIIYILPAAAITVYSDILTVIGGMVGFLPYMYTFAAISGAVMLLYFIWKYMRHKEDKKYIRISIGIFAVLLSVSIITVWDGGFHLLRLCRFVYWISLFSWPYMSYCVQYAVNKRMNVGSPCAEMKSVAVCMAVSMAYWGLMYVLYPGLGSHRYKIVAAIYLMLVSIFVISRENGTRYRKSKGHVWSHVIPALCFVACIGCFLYRKHADAACLDAERRMPGPAYWTGYRFEAVKSFFTHNFSNIQSEYGYEYGHYVWEFLEGYQGFNFATVSYRLGLLAVIPIVILLVLECVLLGRYRRLYAPDGRMIGYCIFGYAVQGGLALMCDMVLMVHDDISFPFTQFGKFMIVPLAILLYESAAEHMNMKSMKKSVEESSLSSGKDTEDKCNGGRSFED